MISARKRKEGGVEEGREGGGEERRKEERTMDTMKRRYICNKINNVHEM